MRNTTHACTHFCLTHIHIELRIGKDAAIHKTRGLTELCYFKGVDLKYNITLDLFAWCLLHSVNITQPPVLRLPDTLDFDSDIRVLF